MNWSNIGESAIGSGVNAILGGIGGFIQNSQQKKLMKYQSELQKGLMDYSNGIWEHQNQVQFQNQVDLTRSSALLQKRGMQQAGMNPNAANYSGNVASAPTGTSAPSGSASGGSAVNPFAGMNFDIVSKAKELEVMDAQKKKIDEEARGEKIKNDYDLLANPERLREIQENISNIQEQRLNMQKERDEIEARTNKTNDDNRRAQELQEKIKDQYQAQIDELNALAAYYDEQKKYVGYNAQTSRMQAQAALKQAEVAGNVLKLSIEKFEFEKNVKWPEEYKEITQRVVKLTAEGKTAEAEQALAELKLKVKKDQGPEWEKWMGDDGYIPQTLGVVGGAISDILTLSLLKKGFFPGKSESGSKVKYDGKNSSSTKDVKHRKKGDDPYNGYTGTPYKGDGSLSGGVNQNNFTSTSIL